MNINLKRVIDLMLVPGESGKERKVAEYIHKELLAIGVPAGYISYDFAHKQSEYGGEIGNLIVHFKGNGRGKCWLLSTHLDTVPAAVGCRPQLSGNRIINSAPGRSLGADARAGCAILIAAAEKLVKRKGNHPPVTFVFFVQEEVGLVGSRGLEPGLLGKTLPSQGFNFDGTNIEEIISSVIGTERLNILVKGVAAHASEPDKGISAVRISSRALNELERDGWVGKIIKKEREGTSNLGIIKGGTGSNVVMAELYALIEARAFDHDFRVMILQAWKEAFDSAVQWASQKYHSEEVSVNYSPGPAYDAYRLPENAKVVRTAEDAVCRLGVKPRIISNAGGMDSNNLVSLGIPTVGLGTGERQPHSENEWLDVNHFLKGCELAEYLVLNKF